MDAPHAIQESAKKHFKDHFQRRNHSIVHSARDKDPRTDKQLFLFCAIGSDRPNEVVELVLSEEGERIDLGRLRKHLFTGKADAIPEELVSAARVTINPPFDRLRLTECEQLTETITVTIPKGSAVAPADIYFLCDNTGSMGLAIANVISGAGMILSALSLPGLQFGVGIYRDFDNLGDPLSAAFQNLQPITNSIAAVNAAINSWSASGGGDTPEAQLFAIDQVAQPPGGSIGWRSGVEHIIVWIGDAPGHDPICKAITGFSYDISEASVTAKLTGNFTVLALSIDDRQTPGNLDGDPTIGVFNPAYAPCGVGGAAGQATRITSATGGILVNGLNPLAVAKAILTLLQNVLTIHNVHLQPVGAIVPFVTSITPPSYGPLSSGQAHVLPFRVTFDGSVVDCAVRDRKFTGAIDAVVDGHVVAVKPTEILVPACKYAYAVKFVCGVQNECECGCGPVRPGAYATEINIFNAHCKEARITKRLVPLVFAGVPTGREPAAAKPRTIDQIVLAPGEATMDDCCRIATLLYGGVPPGPMPLTVGVLEIVSDQELQVTAVYTATDLKGGALSMSVEKVSFQLT